MSPPSPIDARTDEALLATPLDSASPADPASAAPPPEIDPASLDVDALKVLRHLRRNGHQAYLVGGCVRDLLLGRRPKDFDIATSAHPEQVRATFRNCRLIGRRFRLAHIYFKGQKIIEVATFRKNPVEEVLAEDPTAVDTDLLISEDNVFGTAEEDARRRDFTINGLFYDVGLGEVIDYVSGRGDLETRTIRTIGTPEIRLREDPVRLLRAVRFAAKLDLNIDPETWTAMQHSVGELARCAPARVFEETLRLLRSGAARRALQLLRDVGALPILLPSVATFLEQSPPIEAERLFGVLGAMDERIAAGLPTEDSLLLAALLLRIVRVAPDDSKSSPLSSIEPVIAELTRTARLPRRIAESAKLLLLAQSALLGERRRRGSPTRFVRSPRFADALILMAANVQASGEGSEALERWRARQAELKGSPTSAPGPTGASAGMAPAEGSRRRSGKSASRGAPSNGAAGDSGAAPTAEPLPSFTFEGFGLL